MMTRPPTRRLRGLTMIELLLAISVTAMVAAAIASMLAAVSAGVVTKRDARSLMVHASTARTRLAAYIGPSRCLLDAGESNIVLWLNDSRKSDTVHATELRWLLFDATAGTIDVLFVRFPSGWSQADCDLADQEYPVTADWSNVLVSYQTNGWIGSFTLVDGLAAVNVNLDAVDPLEAEHVTYELGVDTVEGAANIAVSATIHVHQPPSF
jgi:type II secretory pathway pseudopilin PulG